jgi:hypothetical protein
LDEYGRLTEERNAKLTEAQKIKDQAERRKVEEQIRIDFQAKVKAMMERQENLPPCDRREGSEP